MTTARERLATAGYHLPDAGPLPAGQYRSVVRHDAMVMTSGQVCLRDGELLARGRVGVEVDQGLAIRCAAQAALNALAAVDREIGLDRVIEWLFLRVYLATKPDFGDHVTVADGASDVLHAAHPSLPPPARAAIGVASLPLGAPIELELSLLARSRRSDHSGLK